MPYTNANPFTTTFGTIPDEYISRAVSTSQIIDDFSASHSTNQVYIITGVRGSGKSVSMTKIEDFFTQKNDWIVIELSTTWDMLEELASQLSDRRTKSKVSLTLSTPVISMNVSKKEADSTPNTRIIHELDYLRKQGTKLLIAVDEAVNNKYMRQFASAFQIYLKKYRIYLIMTGLYENIRELKDEKNLTFLYRAPTEELQPLNMNAIREKYETIFKIPSQQAMEMAKITKGYPYAFQVLGALYWNERDSKPFNEILNDLDDWLAKYVYGKIWSELSRNDQDVIRAIAMSDTSSVTTIRKQLGMTPGKFGVYRKRLLEKQLIVSNAYGEVSLSLPRFDVFIQNSYYD